MNNNHVMLRLLSEDANIVNGLEARYNARNRRKDVRGKFSVNRYLSRLAKMIGG